MTSESSVALEQQIDRWREFLRHRQAIHSVDVAELEDHLREQVLGLIESGLAEDEAFLVAVKRMGNLDALSREFAREHSERLWKQLVLPAETSDARGGLRFDGVVAFCLAILAAILIKIPALFGLSTHDDAPFYLRNSSLFVLPLVTGYFVWKRRAASIAPRWLALGFAAAIAFANAYPFVPNGHTSALTALHLPIGLWLLVGVAYAGDRWSQVSGRMDFIRFSGEFFIYYVLIALGGGVFTLLMGLSFRAIGINVEPFFQSWLLPCGAVGAVIVASWLVEAKQSVIENMAPVLTRLFTPLFALLLVVFLVTMVSTGRAIGVARDELIAFDLLLVVVLALLLYSVSARDASAPAGPFDLLQVVLLVSALAADVVALWAIAARISEFGFTPNRVAALGENVILLVNLAWSALLYVKFMQGVGSFARLERWQTDYLPVYAIWAAIVVIVFPVVFRFI